MINLDRRTLLKTAGLATVSASASFSGLASESTNSPFATLPDNQESDYQPIPQQAKATEGIMPLPEGAGLYYRDTGGNGPAVVFSHPGRGSILSWPYQQPAFAAAGFRTVTYSRRGRFGSPPGSTEDTGSLAGDLDTLMTFLKIDQFHIVGLAAGGFTASDYAVSYPGKLKSMVIICSLFGLWDQEIDSRSDFILPKEFSSLPPEFKELGPTYRWAQPQGVKEWLKMEEQSKGDGKQVRQRAKSKVSWERLRALNIPTFFITGGADLYQPPSMMRAAAREIPGSQSLVVPEAGHALQWEQPALFNKVVIEFLQKPS